MAADEVRPLRVAVVGAGYFSQFHYDAWSRIEGVELVALVDPDAERAEATAARYGVPRTFASLGSAVDNLGVNLFDIVTPPQTHHEIVARCLGAADLLICQKPLAPTLAEAEAIVALAEDAGCPLVVHENFRFQPWYRQAKAMIAAGDLGALHGVSFRLRPGDGQGPEAYLSRQPYFQQMERFLIHETGVHFIDTFRYLLGEVTAVTARLRRLNPVIAGEDAGTLILEFEGGASGLFDGNRLNDHDAEDCRLTMGEMHLEGEKGVLRLDGRGRLWLKPHGGAEAEVAYDRPAGGFAGDCVHALIAHVVDHLRSGAPLENSGRDYLRNMAIVEAVYRSHETGARMTL